MRVTVERLGHLGDGVAAGPVFVPGALPGEVVEGALVGERIADPRIVTPSPDRVSADCPHYRACGGCSLMHVRPSVLAAWKQDIVRHALGDLVSSDLFRPVHTSPDRSRRRATLAGRRTKTGALVGFHGRASGIIADIPGCRLLIPELIEALGPLRRVVEVGTSRKAELDLTVTQTDTGLDLAVAGGKPLTADLIGQLSAIAAEAGFARITWGTETATMATPPRVRFGGTAVTLPPGAFLQATADGEAALLAAVRSALGDAGRIADLFAGCGTFSLPLAERAEVHAVEFDRDMLAALDGGWRGGRGLHRVTTEARDLFRRPLLPDELRGFDAVVIDPPRAGAEAQAAELARSRIGRIAMVSCNPITFARDARLLAAAGFRIDWLQVVDQFRWSPHVELVARMSR